MITLRIQMPVKISPADRLPVPVELIERRIYVIRHQKVMIDSDLADLYQVETFSLEQGRQTQPRPLPCGFHVTVNSGRSQWFEIPNWNVKRGWSRRPALPALCVHGTWRGYAFFRAQQQTSGAYEYPGSSEEIVGRLRFGQLAK